VEAVVKRDERDRPFELPSAELELAASIRGRVVDARGEPVSGARVGIGVVPLYLPQGALPEGLAVTDARGEFVLERVPSGTQSLNAYSRMSGRGTSQPLEIDPGEELRDVEVRLTEPPDAPSEEFRAGVAITLGERDERSGVSVVVVQVAEGSEAARAGLLAGDVVVAVDGARVSSMAQARQALGGPAASDVVVSIIREGTPRDLRVTRESVSH
jgi:S1-C subfamily serine protease